MALGIWFWILLLLWLILGAYHGWKNSAGQWIWAGPWLLEFFLWIIVGMALFGGPIKGR